MCAVALGDVAMSVLVLQELLWRVFFAAGSLPLHHLFLPWRCCSIGFYHRKCGCGDLL